MTELEDASTDESDGYSTEEDTSTDDGHESSDNECHEIFENYSCSSFEPFQDSNSQSINNSIFLWIILWIMSFRMRFNLLETATESLIKFFKLVLIEISGSDFDTFPNSLYQARKDLDLKDRFHSFVTCPKCHKLYN